jgi:hypothetical protein
MVPLAHFLFFVESSGLIAVRAVSNHRYKANDRMTMVAFIISFSYAVIILSKITGSGLRSKGILE